MTTSASYLPVKQEPRAQLAADAAEYERRKAVTVIPAGVETGVGFGAFALKGTPEGGKKSRRLTAKRVD